MAELSDETYMHRVREGEISELSVLFERYHKRIYSLYLKLTHDTTVSQDLTQNLFQRIIKYRHSFRDDSIFKPWIYRMARNIHIDHCNEQKRMDSRAVNLEQYDEYAADTNEPYGADEFRLLDEALLKLSPEQQEIIILSRYQGLKYEEISAIRNTSVGAIKVQMHRAIKQLREIYFKQT